ncbi:MAG TPA: hypothetical protein VKU00_34840 [Chthonomonadaceae bacterium]|nr:hypothetical protein [Chthonomonadaceae bacterium]
MKNRVKIGLLLSCSLVGLAALTLRPAGAEHFDCILRVEAPHSQGEAGSDTTPPLGGVNPRPVVKAKVGEDVHITWKMKNAFPHGTMKKVTIHFFVVKEAKTGQKPVPDPAGAAGIVDNSFVMDFEPNAAATGALRLKFTDPGSYLVRVQSEDTHQEHDHEHFSAIDVEVE